MTHICVNKLTIIGSDNDWPAPSHYLNQCCNIVNWNLRNKLQWNLNRNSNTFIQENAFEIVVCETAAIFSRPQCVNKLCSLKDTGMIFLLLTDRFLTAKTLDIKCFLLKYSAPQSVRYLPIFKTMLVSLFVSDFLYEKITSLTHPPLERYVGVITILLLRRSVLR